MIVPFNRPPKLQKSLEYIEDDFHNGVLRGNGGYADKCEKWLENHTGAARVMMTPSCSAALEMAAILCNVGPGDEIIMPSYTFCSTANAFVMRGAVPVFSDVSPETMNIDTNCIEAAITERSRVIVVVHYAGVSCDMDTIMDIARRYNLLVVEDAAQGLMSTYKGKALGTMGDFGCISFHETKNYSMGEGGALVVNRSEMIERAEILREKGTNRSQFLRGQIDKYSWVDVGSSYLPGDLSAAMLLAQLEQAEVINENRMSSWHMYERLLRPLAEQGKIELPVVPKDCKMNGHIFYIKTKDIEERTSLIDYLKQAGVVALFHYVPLHSSQAGRKYGRFAGQDCYTTTESNRLVRLPMFYGLTKEQLHFVVQCIFDFYHISIPDD